MSNIDFVIQEKYSVFSSTLVRSSLLYVFFFDYFHHLFSDAILSCSSFSVTSVARHVVNFSTFYDFRSRVVRDTENRDFLDHAEKIIIAYLSTSLSESQYFFNKTNHTTKDLSQQSRIFRATEFWIRKFKIAHKLIFSNKAFCRTSRSKYRNFLLSNRMFFE